MSLLFFKSFVFTAKTFLFVCLKEVLVMVETLLCVGIEPQDVLVVGVLAPLLELVVEAFDHQHYGDMGLHWRNDDMEKELYAFNYESVTTSSSACLQ
jgi:hypothetical protein